MLNGRTEYFFILQPPYKLDDLIRDMLDGQQLDCSHHSCGSDETTAVVEPSEDEENAVVTS